MGLTSPLLHSFGVSVLGLAPLALFAPLASLRGLSALLLAALLLGLSAAVVALPLLHAFVRRPPPPPPPPPPSWTARTPSPAEKLLTPPPARMNSYTTFGGASSTPYYCGSGCLAEWAEGGTVPSGGLGADWSAK